MASIYWRARVTTDSKDNYQLDAAGEWRFLPVPTGAGKPPVWLATAKETAAQGGRGFQYRLSGGKFSVEQYATIAEAQAAANGGVPVAPKVNGVKSEAVEATGVGTSLASAIDSFMYDLKLKPASVDAYRNDLKIFLNFLTRGQRTLEYIEGNKKAVSNNFYRFLQNSYAPKTIENKMTNVATFLKSVNIPDFTTVAKLPKLPFKPAVPYTEEELSALFSAMDTKVQGKKLVATGENDELVAFRFFLDTACREAEVSHATWEDVDFKNAVYMVQAKNWKENGQPQEWSPKSYECRELPLSRELVELLKERRKTSNSTWIFPNNEGVPEGHFLRNLQQIAKRAGLDYKKFGLHRLRKTRASFWERNQVPVRTIQVRLGHESLETTMRYLGVTANKALVEHDNLPMYKTA